MEASSMRRRRKLVVSFLALLVALELGSALAFPLFGSGTFSFARLKELRAGVVEGAGVARGAEDSSGNVDEEILMRIRDQVVHPFVGFVLDPAANDDELEELLGGRRITDYGFISAGELFQARAPERVVIGITGGSVALFFALRGAAELAASLAASPELAGKEIVFCNLALLGYKQPQQLAALSYALVLGAHFDWVINLDGFNELALPAVENVPKGVAPIFPRSWYWRVAELPDPELQRLRAEVFLLQDERRELAANASRAPFCYSVTWNLIWSLRDSARTRRTREVEAELVDRTVEGEAAFVARGPSGMPGSGPELWDHLVGIWERSSLAMHHLAAGHGIRYLHALQPNQYVAGSKPMSPAEARLAVSETSRFREPVEEGYPRLIEAGRRLVQAGVSFHDMTMVFADVTQPLYEDNCCHFDRTGNLILGRALAALMLAELREN